MWADTEEARSDFVLTAAALVFGGFIVSLVAMLPFYPRSGIVAALLSLAWLFALTALVPLLLARYRDQTADAFGLDTGREAVVPGLALAAPVVVAAVLRSVLLGGTPVRAVLGRFAGAGGFDPRLADPAGAALSLFDLVLAALTVAVLTVGGVLLYTFLTTRARDGFRRVELPLTQALRSFGMAAAGIAALLGLLRSIAGAGLLPTLVTVAGLVALVLLADRLIPAGVTTGRAAILGPAVVALVAAVVGTGGLFGNLLGGLFVGSLAGGVAIVIACLVESRRAAWAVVPMVAAMAVYPASCLSPLSLQLLGAC